MVFETKVGIKLSNKAELQRNLAEAKAAYHKLMLGRSARVFVDQNGERVEYTAANASRLSAYIKDLETALGLVKIAGPMRPFFP